MTPTSWIAISAVCAVLGIIGAGMSAIYRHIGSIKTQATLDRDRANSDKDRALNEKLDSHFNQQKETLGRVDTNLERMGRILESHMIILNDHSTRLAVAETKLDHMDHSNSRRTPTQ